MCVLFYRSFHSPAIAIGAALVCCGLNKIISNVMKGYNRSYTLIKTRELGHTCICAILFYYTVVEACIECKTSVNKNAMKTISRYI